jgi:hypothetical protein
MAVDNNNNNNHPHHTDDDDTRYAVDIRVFVSVIVIAMAVSFGVGVGLGPNGNLASLTAEPTTLSSATAPKLPPVTSVQVAEADDFSSDKHDELHEPAGQVRLTARRLFP